MGTVFECSFLLHGGGIVTSGPATVTLTPTEGSSPPQCIEEVARESSIIHISFSACYYVH